MFRSTFQDLTRLATFSGREGRPQFWSWAVLVLTLLAVTAAALTLPMVTGSMQRMHAFALAHPEQSKVIVGPNRYSVQIQGHHPELMPDVGAILPATIILFVLGVVLLAAAVVRRLHDTGRRAWWGLLPLPFAATGFALLPRLIDSFARERPDVGLFLLLFANNLAYLAALGLLGVLLAGRPTGGPNRFGP